ncbi:MAG TPA: hypothetical protein VE666_08850, partial [Mycobacterium sp.]|nr:hypothetical protein [Mycobacterium sp.]
IGAAVASWLPADDQTCTPADACRAAPRSVLGMTPAYVPDARAALGSDRMLAPPSPQSGHQGPH